MYHRYITDIAIDSMCKCYWDIALVYKREKLSDKAFSFVYASHVDWSAFKRSVACQLPSFDINNSYCIRDKN